MNKPEYKFYGLRCTSYEARFKYHTSKDEYVKHSL